jgi:hypothetical protein
LNNQGVELWRAGRTTDAAEFFRAAIASDWSNVQPHFNLALIASDLRDEATFYRELNAVRALDPARADKLLRTTHREPPG